MSAVIVLCGSTANADLTNGGFEDVDLTGTGWTIIGHVQARTDEYSRDMLGLLQAPASGFWYPTQGSYFASLLEYGCRLGNELLSNESDIRYRPGRVGAGVRLLL